MTIKTETYEVPDFYLSYMFNGDSSGLTEEEIAAFDKFTEDVQKENGQGHWSHSEQDGGFSNWHDLRSYGILSCNCHDVEWVIMG